VNLNGATKLGLLDRKKRGDRAAEVQVYGPGFAVPSVTPQTIAQSARLGLGRPIFVTDSAHK